MLCCMGVYFMNLKKEDKVSVDIMKIPDYAFMQGVACKDVVQLRILSSEEKKGRKWGEPDVEVKSMWYKNANKVMYITRKEAGAKFYLPNGNKLSTSFLKANQKYIVTADLDNIPVHVLAPSGKKAKYMLNGKELPDNVYLVFVTYNGTLMLSSPLLLKPEMCIRMITLKESSKTVAARIRRYDTATEDRKNAQYRVVAVAVDKQNYKKVGYILSFMQESGKYKEQLCSMQSLVPLLENNNVRNMRIVKDMSGKRQEELTYGRLIELPTHYINTSVSKK